MKQYIVEPNYKKSVVEIQTFKKEINGINHWLRYEDCWRWGGFAIAVPETDEEFADWAKHQGYDTFAEWCEDYDFDPKEDNIEQYALPDEDEENVMIFEDYGWNAEMIETWDGGCWSEWTIHAYGDDAMPEEERDEEAERLSEVYWENYEEGLAEAGWEFVDADYIVNDFNIRPVPEGKSVYEAYENKE
jgi:hypothetical protein